LGSIYLTAFCCAALGSLVLSWCVREAALRWGLVFASDSARHLHSRPVPRLGGVAIYFVFSSMMVAGLILFKVMKVPNNTPWLVLATLLGAATLVFLIGLFDDLYGVSAWWKLLVEVMAALLLVSGGFHITKMNLLVGAHNFGPEMGAVLTVMWVLVITNAFNLIDGLDGLAAGSAFCSSMIIFLAMLYTTQINSALLMTMVLSGAILGFLRYNFNPASIFLGDSGSLFIGFILSTVSMLGSSKSTAAVAVGVPVIAFGLPILDVFVAIVRRFVNGQPIFKADGGHIHHRLLQLGWTHRSAVLLLYLITTIFGALSLLLVNTGILQAVLVFLSVILVVVMGMRYLSYHEFNEIGRVARRVMDQRHMISNNLLLRRASSALLKCRSLEDIRNEILEAFTPNEFESFRLEIKAWPKDRAVPGGYTLDNDGNAIVHWRKSNADLPTWSFRLDLRAADGADLGSFTVHHLHSSQPMMVDIHMLIMEFPQALADAISRSLAAAEHASPLVLDTVSSVPPILPVRLQ